MADVTTTEEMLNFLHGRGIEFEIVRQFRIECGCMVLVGWETDTHQEGRRVLACSPWHKPASERALARWRLNPVEDMAALLRSEGCG